MSFSFYLLSCSLLVILFYKYVRHFRLLLLLFIALISYIHDLVNNFLDLEWTVKQTYINIFSFLVILFNEKDNDITNHVRERKLQ